MRRTSFAGFIISLLLFIGLSAGISPAAAHPFDQTYESAVQALDAYRALVKDYPEDLELHYLLGTMLVMANQLDEAKGRFDYVLKKKPDYEMAWYKLAEVYYRKEDYRKALEQLSHMKDKTLQDDRLIAEATCYLKLKKFDKALAASEKAIKTDELNPGGWLHKGLAKKELGKPEEAVELILKSLKMDPGQPLVYDWFKELIDKNLKPHERVEALTDLYRAIPYDSPTARQIQLDIYHLKRKEK